MKFRYLVISLFVLSAFTLTPHRRYSSSAQSELGAQSDLTPATKIAPWLRQHSVSGKSIEALVVLQEQADVSAADGLETKAAKGRFVREVLLEKANATQADLLAWLQSNQIEHRAFYIINAVWVNASPEIIELLAARPDVARIEANPTIKNNFTPRLNAEEVEEAAAALLRERATATAPNAIEPGVMATRAPEVWAQGFTGQGIVIGGADTGVRWDHDALKNQYRGWDGAMASHDFNWHDSIHDVRGNPCGSDTVTPCDDNNHGTHTLGTAVGTDGKDNQIGVAPGAKWIACRNMNSGDGTPARYIECMEWFLAPYPVNGRPAQGDATKAPDITVNSWGCPPSEGCSPDSLQAAVEAQRAAGILMVVAAGNDGPNCSTTVDPPSFYAASYSVGAINAASGSIASFSGRGPVTVDGSNRMKPDITAPGVVVRSAVNRGGYANLSGTSMATPHVAGAIALLWSAAPALRRQMQPTIDLLNSSAVDVPFTGCDSRGVPNNVYGWGRLDIKAAVDQANLPPPTPTPTATPTPTPTATPTPTPTGELTALPDPIQVCDRSGTGAANLTWTTTNVTNTQIRIGSANGFLYRTGGATGSLSTGKWVTEGMTFFLLNADNGVTLATATAHLTTANCNSRIATLNATPQPIQVCDGSGIGVTTLTWDAPTAETTRIVMGSPNGPVFTTGGSSGLETTGKWVSNGMTFYLLNGSNGRVLASTVVNVTDSTCTRALLLATPNPIQVCDGTGFGVATLSWSASTSTPLEIRIGSATGRLFVRSDSATGAATTDKWVTNDMSFYLLEAATGKTLAAVTINLTTAGCPPPLSSLK